MSRLYYRIIFFHVFILGQSSYPSQFKWLDQVKDILIQRAASKESILMRKKYFAPTMRLVIIIPSRDAQLLFRRACSRKYQNRYQSSMRDGIMD